MYRRDTACNGRSVRKDSACVDIDVYFNDYALWRNPFRVAPTPQGCLTQPDMTAAGALRAVAVLFPFMDRAGSGADVLDSRISSENLSASAC